MQAIDMLDPLLPLYPNPTRQCSHLCSFNSPCVSMDDGSDYEYELELGYEYKPGEYDGWRVNLPHPEELNSIPAIDTSLHDPILIANLED